MDAAEIESKKLELQKRKEELDDAIRRFQQELSVAKQELETINGTFPNLLAREFMGYGKAEANRVRRRRTQLIRFIEESPLVQSGFCDEKKRINGEAIKIDMLKRDLAQYQDLKNQLLENPRRTDLENRLLGLGHELNCLPEAQAFLQELKAGR